MSEIQNKIINSFKQETSGKLMGVEGALASNDFVKSLSEDEYCDNCDELMSDCVCDKDETTESTSSGSAGAYSAPLFGEEITESNSTVTSGLYNGPVEIGLKKWRKSELGPYSEISNIDNYKKITKKDLKKNVKRVVGMWEKGVDGTYDIETHDVHTVNENKVETKEATSSSSSGSYTANGFEDVKMKGNHKRGSGRSYKKPQIPGGKFVEVKAKCKKFPYCNQGDIKALKIFENEKLQEAIKNVSKKMNISESVIKNIIAYEYENRNLNK